MNDRDGRALGWLLMHVVYFPLLVVSLRGWHGAVTLLTERGVVIPGWLHTASTFLVFAALYMGLAYAVAAVLNRRYPSTPVTSADWEDSPGFRRK